MKAKPDMTTIWISKQLRDELAALGSKGTTYQQIIQRLLEHKEVSK